MSKKMRKQQIIGLFSLIVASKGLSTASPYVFKHTIDQHKETKDYPILIGIGAFFMSRFASIYLNECRNVLVHKASYSLTTEFCLQTIRSHSSSVYTPVFIKQLERARKAHKALFTIKYTHIIPTALEIGMSATLITQMMGSSFCGILLGTVGWYMYRSVQITNKRVQERKEFNQAENELYKNKDSSLNESAFKGILDSLAQAEQKLIISLKHLNTEQQLILASGNLAILGLWYLNPALMVSDLVMMHLLTQQLYQPLNQVGMIYREWTQSKLDVQVLNKAARE